MSNIHSKKYAIQKGFTLVELLLYIGIAAVILLVSSLFLTTFLEARVKNQTISEVEQQGLLAIKAMTQSIRNAESITSPTLGGSGSTLTLEFTDSGLDPTVFSLSSGVLYITEGASSAVALT